MGCLGVAPRVKGLTRDFSSGQNLRGPEIQPHMLDGASLALSFSCSSLLPPSCLSIHPKKHIHTREDKKNGELKIEPGSNSTLKW